MDVAGSALRNRLVAKASLALLLHQWVNVYFNHVLYSSQSKHLTRINRGSRVQDILSSTGST